ncbi:MAG TPA: hypothetical protein VKT73_14810 [Xanthobacteraceae bacterium]|nr:hypothetical protein [Xanthobacteraceae bacterium]
MTIEIVKKRCFLCVGGYEPVTPDWWHQRFVRELKRFEKTWNATATTSEPVASDKDGLASWKISATAPGWRTDTDFVLLRWDDFVTADFARSKLERVPRGLLALGDFIVSGAAYRYLRSSIRYFLFFLYPFVLFAGLIAAAVAIPYVLTRFGLPIPAPLAALLAIALFIGFLYWPGRFLLIDYLLDDWIFADELVHRSRAGLDARIDRFARELVQRARDRSYDELVVSGHSLGGALMMEIVDRALKLDPALGQQGPVLWLMSTGSSLLKIALHPKAEWIRVATGHVADAPHLNWVEYQAIVDVISFYKTDPVVEMGLPDRDKPIVQQVKIRRMLEPLTYKRFWGNFFRLHRQFSMGNELRYFYDYFQIICGPAPLARRVAERDRLLTAFAEDGSYQAGEAPAKAAAVAGKK